MAGPPRHGARRGVTRKIAVECEDTAHRLAKLGKDTWRYGWQVGSVSPTAHGIGDERIYAAGLVIEIAGDVAESAVMLTQTGHVYTAQALMRNLIECEYLLAYFAAKPDAARDWLRTDDATRRTQWTPQKLRNRMRGIFQDEEYWRHSNSSHPSPWGLFSLTDEATAVPTNANWKELQLHVRRVAERADDLVQVLGIEKAVGQD